MKKRILTQFVTVAAGFALPLSVVAQDYSDQSSGESSDSSAAISDSADQNSGSYSPGRSLSSGSSQSSQSQPGTFSGGIMVHDGAAYIVHRLQNEMSLPDGSKVQPNGTIRESNGSTRSIDSGKMLTLDGREMEAPFGTEHGTSNSNPSGIPDSNSSGISNPSSLPNSSSMPGSNSNSSSSQMPPRTSAPSQGSGASNSPSDQSGSSSSSIPGSSSENGGIGSDSGSVSTKDGTDLH